MTLPNTCTHTCTHTSHTCTWNKISKIIHLFYLYLLCVMHSNIFYTFLVFQMAEFLLGSIAPCGKGGITATLSYGYSPALLYHRNHERHVWKRELKGQMEMNMVSSNLHNVCVLMSHRAESTGVVWWCGVKVQSRGTEGTWTTLVLILTIGVIYGS